MSRLRISTQVKVRGALKLGLCLKVRLLAIFKGKRNLIKKVDSRTRRDEEAYTGGIWASAAWIRPYSAAKWTAN